MGDFMVSLIGAYSHEAQVEFEKAVRKAVSDYPYYKRRCKFLEGVVENLEIILEKNGLAQAREKLATK